MIRPLAYRLWEQITYRLWVANGCRPGRLGMAHYKAESRLRREEAKRDWKREG